MRTPEHTAWSGGIWGNEPPVSRGRGLLPHVVIREHSSGGFIATFEFGPQEGPRGTGALPPEHANLVWAVESKMLEDQEAVGSWVEKGTEATVSCPTRGEGFTLSPEPLRAFDRLLLDGTAWEYVANSPERAVAQGIAGTARILSANGEPISIRHRGQARAIDVPPLHLVMGGLRAAAAYEIDWLRAQEIH